MNINNLFLEAHKQDSPLDKKIIDDLLEEYNALSNIRVWSIKFGEYNEYLKKSEYTYEEIAERLKTVIDTLVSYAMVYDFNKLSNKSEYYTKIGDIFRKYGIKEYNITDVEKALEALEFDIDYFVELGSGK